MYEAEFKKGDYGWYWIVRRNGKLIARCNPDVYYKTKTAVKNAFKWLFIGMNK